MLIIQHDRSTTANQDGKYIEIYKGKKLATEKYYLIYADNTEERIGGTWWGLDRFLNPFAKKTKNETIYKFNKDKGCFE